MRNIYNNPNTPDTNLKSIFLIEKPVINEFLKIINAQNQLPITFGSDLVCNRTLKARNSTSTSHEFLTLNPKKVIRK